MPEQAQWLVEEKEWGEGERRSGWREQQIVPSQWQQQLRWHQIPFGQ